MKFDPDVKVTPIGDGKGGATTQPDGSQVSLLEFYSRDGKIESCIQSSLDGVRFAKQPVCSGSSDAIKFKFSDGKAVLDASMEAELRPDANGEYKGPLLLRIIIIPDGKHIGELILSRI